MHFTNFLLASALTLTPTVYSYAVATVDIAYNEGCQNGEIPHKQVDTSESTIATKDTCTQLPAKHSLDIDAYSFQVTPITKDTTFDCHAVAVYSNDECVGLPLTVVPFWPGQDKAESTCVKDGYFKDNVSVKLVCEDWEKKGHEHGAKGDADEGEEVDEEERQAAEDKPKSGLNPLSALGL
ncbi:protein ccpA [Aspergillus undulatus]|uniref:protein ccpA n=1 Tax=Aspergillus undulatus TaxID=1810928 RepID=UPI003CCDA267